MSDASVPIGRIMLVVGTTPLYADVIRQEWAVNGMFVINVFVTLDD